MASWRSGYAADCKSVYSGSNPDEASSHFPRDLIPGDSGARTADCDGWRRLAAAGAAPWPAGRWCAPRAASGADARLPRERRIGCRRCGKPPSRSNRTSRSSRGMNVIHRLQGSCLLVPCLLVPFLLGPYLLGLRPGFAAAAPTRARRGGGTGGPPEHPATAPAGRAAPSRSRESAGIPARRPRPAPSPARSAGDGPAAGGRAGRPVGSLVSCSRSLDAREHRGRTAPGSVGPQDLANSQDLGTAQVLGNAQSACYTPRLDAS